MDGIFVIQKHKLTWDGKETVNFMEIKFDPNNNKEIFEIQ